VTSRNRTDTSPGDPGLLFAYPDSENSLNALADTVLRGPSSLTRADRELIAAYVSAGNGCDFCKNVHAAACRHLLGERAPLLDAVLADPNTAGLDDELRALLVIAGKVRRSGRLVSPDDLARARAAGADDKAVHDTVLLAAVMCMLNRYVDGFGRWAPDDPSVFDEVGARIAAGWLPEHHPRPEAKARSEGL
jgi:uncharacterized peroxidase-related enzyme